MVEEVAIAAQGDSKILGGRLVGVQALLDVVALTTEQFMSERRDK